LYAIAIGVIREKDRVLITRRPADGLLGGLWEFPGGKIQPGETPEAACVREFQEEVNLRVAVEVHLARIRHAYTHFRIDAEVFVCRRVSGSVALKGPVDHRWVGMDEIDAYPFPKANHKFIPHLKRWMDEAAPALPETTGSQENRS
jgi:A/G-specific adenine glycosylase